MDLITYSLLFICMPLLSTYGVAFAYRKVKESLRHKQDFAHQILTGLCHQEYLVFAHRIAATRKRAIAKEMEAEGKSQKSSKEERDDKCDAVCLCFGLKVGHCCCQNRAQDEFCVRQGGDRFLDLLQQHAVPSHCTGILILHSTLRESSHVSSLVTLYLNFILCQPVTKCV